MFIARYRSALELSPSIRLEQTRTCAVFQEEDSLSGCSSDHSSPHDESDEPNDTNVDVLGTQANDDDDRESGECWD
jgi:hypothetical protein